MLKMFTAFIHLFSMFMVQFLIHVDLYSHVSSLFYNTCFVGLLYVVVLKTRRQYWWNGSFVFFHEWMYMGLFILVVAISHVNLFFDIFRALCKRFVDHTEELQIRPTTHSVSRADAFCCDSKWWYHHITTSIAASNDLEMLCIINPMVGRQWQPVAAHMRQGIQESHVRWYHWVGWREHLQKSRVFLLPKYIYIYMWFL